VRIRTQKLKSGSIAVQVVEYKDGKTKFVKHVGCGTNEDEIFILKKTAQNFINHLLGQETLFKDKSQTQEFLLGNFKNLGVKYNFFGEEINKILKTLGLLDIPCPLLLHLTIARIFEPSSKLQSQKTLARYFGINYEITSLYKSLPWVLTFKDAVENKLIEFAKTRFGFDFSFVLYDVTTLYFESFSPDEFRRPGFSKDNKSNQPQIVVGLMVDNNGFPLTYSVFEGNKFEGKTFLPVIKDFQKKYNVKTLTVVADAAMISWDNVQKLTEAGLSYIVGARLGNLNINLITEISQNLGQLESANLRKETDKGFLVCDFSQKRFNKDKSDMDKQIEKAKSALENNHAVKRLKFLTSGKAITSLNQALIEKTKLQLGIKGYYTNLTLPNETIISRYHDLWKIEKAFRISKSDLLVRPIFHFKRPTIEAHLLICVTALSVIKFVEIETGQSARNFVEILKMVTDTWIRNPQTKEEFFWRSEIPEDIKIFLEKLSKPH
jgi:hypothetical protein